MNDAAHAHQYAAQAHREAAQAHRQAAQTADKHRNERGDSPEAEEAYEYADSKTQDAREASREAAEAHATGDDPGHTSGGICNEIYDYAVSPINDYYRSILEMSGRGWPGGLRWLHGEDAA